MEVSVQAAGQRPLFFLGFVDVGCAVVDTERAEAKRLRGRGAFCKPAKVAREGCWRYQKCEC